MLHIPRNISEVIAEDNQQQKDGSWSFGIHEVYYDEETGKPHAFTENPVCPQGASYGELKKDLAYMRSDILTEKAD